MQGAPDLTWCQTVSQGPQTISSNSLRAQQASPSKLGGLVSMLFPWTMIETDIVQKYHKFRRT